MHLFDKHSLDYRRQVTESHPARVFRAAQPIELFFAILPTNHQPLSADLHEAGSPVIGKPPPNHQKEKELSATKSHYNFQYIIQ